MSDSVVDLLKLAGKGLGWVFEKGRGKYFKYRSEKRVAEWMAASKRQQEAEDADPLLREARLARRAREREEREAQRAAMARAAAASRAKEAEQARQAELERQRREAQRLEAERAQLARFVDELSQGDPDPLIVLDTNVWIDHELSVRQMVRALVASGRRLKVYGEQERELDSMSKRRSASNDLDKQEKAEEKASKAARARRLMDDLSKNGGLELVRAKTNVRIFDDFVDRLAETAQREGRTLLVASDDRELRMRVHSRAPIGGSKRIRALDGDEFKRLIGSVVT